ncbi:hypothetical protein RCH22_000225 [Cryobacterium psychrotolerans]|nr:hypothetical protein [Cryobacterium psychrotolerans]
MTTGVAAIVGAVLVIALTVGARLRMAKLLVSPPTRMVAA